jgi:hypothetical protein
MHLEEEQIQRLLHGELEVSARAEAEQHIAACASCRHRFEEAGQEEKRIFDLLERTDHPAPEIDPEAIAERARSSTERTPPLWCFFGKVQLRWVAGIALVLAAAGIAYTAPGSPVRAWVDQAIGWIAGTSGEAPFEEPVPPSLPEPGMAGIAVEPGAQFTILFTETQSEGRVAVSLTDGPNIVARALSGSVTFTTDVDRLTIGNSGARTDYEIELPVAAARVEILIGERRHFLKRGEEIVTNAPTDSLGRHLLPLTPAAP